MTGPAATLRREVEPWIVGAAFVALAVAWGLSSTAFQEADDVTHYFFSRWLFRYPEKAVEIWGRPFVTLYYALPAQLGPSVARTSSVLLGLVVTWAAVRLFRNGGGRRPALAVACTLGMPYVFLQLYGILTEISFAALLGAGFVLYRTLKPRAAAIVWSLLPLARPEGFFLAPLFALAFLAAPAAHPSRPWTLPRFSCASLLAVGSAVWWLAGLPIYRNALWLKEEWPRNWRVASVYGDGHPLLFIGFLALVTTPLLFPFFVVGVIRFWRAHLRLEVVVVAFVVVLHSVLWTFGLFGSAGYPRYLVTVAPLLGALAARGVEALIEAWESRKGPMSRGRHAAIAGVLSLCLLGGIVAWPHSGPVHGDADAQMLRTIWPWCEKELAKRPDVRFVADHPFFFVQGDLDGVRNGYPFAPHVVEYAEVGAVAIWETKFAGRYSLMKDRECLRALGFEPVSKEEVAGKGPYPWEGPRSRWVDPELENFEWDVLREASVS